MGPTNQSKISIKSLCFPYDRHAFQTLQIIYETLHIKTKKMVEHKIHIYEGLSFSILDYFLKMMKQQLKIKSFIKLINKIHSKKKEEPYIVIQQFSEEQPKENAENEVKTVTARLDDHNDKKHASTFQGSNPKSLSQTNQIGIFFTQQSIKQRYDEKKSLYDVYRETLQKKKDHLTHIFLNKNQQAKKSVIHDDYINQTYEGNFPYNRNLVIKHRRESFNNQRLLKSKKSTFRGNRSIPMIYNDSSERFLKMQIRKTDFPPEQEPKNFNKSSQMRKRKLDYKPMFRVKRLAFETNKTEIAQSDETAKFEKYAHKSNHVKTEQFQSEEKRISFRQKCVQKKRRRSKMHFDMNDKFSAWDNEHTERPEESELLTKFLL